MDINVEEIMESIRAEIRDKQLYDPILSFDEIPIRNNAGVSAEFDEDGSIEDIKAGTYQMSNNYFIDYHKALTGNPIKVFIKKIIRRLVGFYIVPIVQEQIEFNLSTARTVDTISKYIYKLEDENLCTRKLESEIEVLRKRIDKLENGK